MNKIAYFEVCQKVNSTISKEDIISFTKKAFEKWSRVPLNVNLVAHLESAISESRASAELIKHTDSIVCTIDEEKNDDELQSWRECDMEPKFYETWKVFVYSLSQEGAAMETMNHDSEELGVASHIILPAVEYKGLWESLYYDTDIKNKLLNFIQTTMIFSDKNVDPNIISWNKVILLHGPPGTGKTSLCKALAQKAAIRLQDRYSYVELIEINSHSLFSKWFSESGKLVMKLFDEVRRLLQNSNALVCVLIDEVESLAHARKSCVNGTEPSDAIRVVNALLTQLDQIKSYPNVMILTTSNVTEAIDLAFVDRADIKQYIGHPRAEAIYQIYKTCLHELMRTGLLTTTSILPVENVCSDDSHSSSLFLYRLSKSSVGLSGRSLRKIPFLTHAMYVKSKGECDIETFLTAMKKTVVKHKLNDFETKI